MRGPRIPRALGLAACAAVTAGAACAAAPAARPAIAASDAGERPGAGDGGRFPRPPMQRAPWSTSARLPAALLDAARLLFVQGFADPRGCAYREIAIAIGDLRPGDAGAVHTRGFVLPGERHAVAWNGLVYPVVSVGGPGDLARDVAAASELGSHPLYPMLIEERASVAPDRNLAMVVLLARFGEDELAEQVWDALHLPQDPSYDPYGEIALRWAWRLFDRALAAHRRGAHGLAVESLRLLTAAQPLIDTAAALRGLRGPDGGATYLDFLAAVPALLDDEERRAARGPRPLPSAALSRRPVAEQVARLVDHLDDVGAAGVDLAADPILGALVRLGAPAVEPLIDALAGDPRLTRAIVADGDASFARRVLGVDEVAYLALTRILETRLIDPEAVAEVLSSPRPAGRRQLADRFRAHVRRRGAESIEERWYDDLADPYAFPERWLEAARRITGDRAAGGVAAIGLGGEPLRAHAAPSVSELLARRIESADVPTQCALALQLFAWDRAAGAPWLDWTLTRAIGESGTTHQFAAEIAQLTERRLATGDLAVLDTYAAWLGASALETPLIYAEVQVRFPLDVRVFRPMAAAPWRPSIARAAEALFRDGSPWVPLLNADRLHGDDPIALLDGDLLAVAAFNRHVVKALADVRPIGRITVAGGRRLRLQLTDGWALVESVQPDATPLPPDGTERVVRLADWYAERLAHGHTRDGAPRFELFWSDAERSAALRAMAAWVRTRVAPRPR